MAELLIDFGLPRDQILLEARSRTTQENGRETAHVLADSGMRDVLLVSSAPHMRRAAATFNGAGIRIVTAPTDHEVIPQPEQTLLDYLPGPQALEGSWRASKEHLGLWACLLKGWTIQAPQSDAREWCITPEVRRNRASLRPFLASANCQALHISFILRQLSRVTLSY